MTNKITLVAAVILLAPPSVRAQYTTACHYVGSAVVCTNNQPLGAPPMPSYAPPSYATPPGAAESQRYLQDSQANFANALVAAGVAARARRDARNAERAASRAVQQGDPLGEMFRDEVATFAADPSHPYFNDLKWVMAALMRGGQANTLQQAYDQAAAQLPPSR